MDPGNVRLPYKTLRKQRILVRKVLILDPLWLTAPPTRRFHFSLPVSFFTRVKKRVHMAKLPLGRVQKKCAFYKGYGVFGKSLVSENPTRKENVASRAPPPPANHRAVLPNIAFPL